MIRKTTALRQAIKDGVLVLPGAFNAPVAMMAERIGFKGVYISGAGVSNAAGFPDIGLLSLSEVTTQAAYIANSVSVPAIADADTGFGEALHVSRCVQEFERAGVAGIHLEDQEFPKRCGHLPGKSVISPQAMAQKIRAAVAARKDKDFLIIARTDARAVEGFDAAVKRAKLYLDSGADAIFPEAMQTPEEFSKFAKRLQAPLLANMTEFGRTPLITVEQFADMGYRMVIFPMTAFRVAMKAIEECLRDLKKEGTQKKWLARMQTRKELYELIRYEEFAKLDEALARHRNRKQGRTSFGLIPNR
jgi:methylisocitrate lyase